MSGHCCRLMTQPDGCIVPRYFTGTPVTHRCVGATRVTSQSLSLAAYEVFSSCNCHWQRIGQVISVAAREHAMCPHQMSPCISSNWLHVRSHNRPRLRNQLEPMVPSETTNLPQEPNKPSESLRHSIFFS